MKVVRTVAPFVLGLACGAAAFAAWGAADVPPHAERADCDPAADALPTGGHGEPLDAPTLRRVLRQELASLAPGPAPSAPAAAEPSDVREEDPEVAAEHDAAFAEATKRVEDALYEGVWDEQDATFLRPRLARLRPEDRDEVLARLVPALNSGEVEQRVAGIPF